MSFAQYERHSIVDRIKKGARARAERGLANGHVLLGYKLVEHRPNYREVDENEKPTVELIFRKFLELKRINVLVKYLNENGYRTKEFTTKNGKKAGGNRWTLSSIQGLTLFLDDADVAIDNNAQERLLRSHVVGRKTWYGTHSERGAETAAILFSLVETCKLNKVNPREYFAYLVAAILGRQKPMTPVEYKAHKEQQ